MRDITQIALDEISQPLIAVSPHIACGSQQISLITYPFLGSDAGVRFYDGRTSLLLLLYYSRKMGFGQNG